MPENKFFLVDDSRFFNSVQKKYENRLKTTPTAESNQQNKVNAFVGKVSLSGTDYQMYTGIKNPQLAFEAFGYTSRKPGAQIHANFNWRQGLEGGNAKYCGITKPAGLPDGWDIGSQWKGASGDKWRGWGSAPYNYNGYVNWSFFVCHDGTGRGQESSTVWGSGQVVGTTIYNGEPLGAKTWSMRNRPVYYFLKNDKTFYRRPAKEIYYAKEFTTLDAVYKADFLSNIRVALPVGGGPHILNDKTTGSTAYDAGGPFPFFGKLNNGTYFAGYGQKTSISAQLVKTYFNKNGLKVEWMDSGDGGGSAQLYGQGKAIKASGRPVPAIIGWNE